MLIMTCYGQNNIGISPSGFLTSLPPKIPIQISPSDSIPNLPEVFDLSWKTQINTASYSVQVSKDSDFSSPVIDQQNITDTVYSISGLENKTLYYWRVSASNAAGKSNFSHVWSFTTSPATAINIFSSVHEGFGLHPAYPNPFTDEVTITFQLKEHQKASLVIFNSLGQKVYELFSGNLQAGEYTIKWDGMNKKGFPEKSGIYLCVLRARSNVFTHKIIIKR